MREEEIRTVLTKGILAPSADNLQPWKFRIGENQIDLFLDEARVKSFCDAGYLAPYISAGAVIENIRVAASSHGYDIRVGYFPEKDNELFVASLTLFDGSKEKHPHHRALPARVTNRNLYNRKQKIDSSIFLRLQSIAQEGKGFRLLWIEKKNPKFQQLARLVGRADQLRFENKRLHRELLETLRFSQGEAAKTKDGLDIRTLGGGPGSGILFRWIASWSRLQALNKIGLSRLFNNYAFFQMMSSQAAGFLIGPTQKREDYVFGGEMMERIWHEATLHDLAIQPMEAIPIFIINLQTTGAQDLTTEQRKSVEELRKNFFAIFGISDQNSLIFFFRVGYAKKVQIRSQRRPVESFVYENDTSRFRL
ncbi:MAG: hypothetical protein HY447_03750 [Candidatus Omnitrophica bacterium]|nr:hypothetical protein [Candidatus Omnitrophota bacterium]